MSSILDLPTEILAQVVRCANMDGDLSRLRSSNSTLLDIAAGQNFLLLEDLCSSYGIGPRALSLYFLEPAVTSVIGDDHRRGLLDVLRLGNFLHQTAPLGVDADRAGNHPPWTGGARGQVVSREPFLLFEVFSRALNSSSMASHSTASDLLVPSRDGGQVFWSKFSPEFAHLLKHELSLEEIETIIGAISVCAMKLWSTVFMFRPKDSTIDSFGSLSGASFNTDQAILTEHIIWRGPRWAARMLRLYGPAEAGARPAETDLGAEDRLVKEGIWTGTREDAARLAANGIARLLWKERQLKIEARAAAAVGPVSITDMRVDSSVWRGSSGEM